MDTVQLSQGCRYTMKKQFFLTTKSLGEPVIHLNDLRMIKGRVVHRSTRDFEPRIASW